jgi:hypothetical protein
MNTGIFPPAKRGGLLFHSILLVILTAIAGWALVNLSGTSAGVLFVVYLLVAAVAFAPIPLLAYRAYALFRAQYILDRDSLELRWGLRNETIPLSDIEWVRSVNDLAQPLSGPPLATPGAILGLRRHRDLGVVEFLASARRQLLLVATSKRVYAISPSDPTDFIETFARAVELGSLRTAKPKSLYPSFVITQAWDSGLVRYEWLAALFLNLGLAAWVSLLIPSTSSIALGLRPDQAPELVPSVQLVLIPLLSVFLNLVGWAAGLFFFRWPKWRNLSILLWGSGALATLIFLIAVVFIVTAPA